MAYTVPLLGYPFGALEPHIDAATMEIHHDKHHGAYVGNLNKALEGYPTLQSQPVEKLVSHLPTIPERIRTVVRNNGGGHANHTFFWTIISPGSSPVPTGGLASAIDSQFRGFEEFKTRFEAVGIAHFGSGWVWLVMNKSLGLEIISTSNQDSPISQGLAPILGLDVWEHAYYLKYQNRRADYVRAMWNVMNWDQAERYFLAASAS
ncbi:MAG: superoxide dismutase [Candidatus Xiphinematobacter sp.]|nr:MAG: superoxide dismutase [Candidatus Xiphinematobacter sp.]QQY10530.1 MAG: superoxide dismutase [Candidatus Xiphinematobacter sp.]